MRWAVLAAAAGVATGCTPGGARPVDVVALADSADQVAEGFTHQMTRDGVRRGRIEADSAFFYERTQSIALRRLTATFHDERGGVTSTLTADRGLYRWQSGAWEVEGTVRLRGTDGRQLATEALRYDEGRREIVTDRPFVYTRGAERITGTSFRSDLDFRNVVTQRPRGAVGEAFALPGQE